MAATAAADRDALVGRWFELTRTTLPRLARARAWPIHDDHCFMRVCLDAAFARPWDEVVARPAIRHLARADLARAVAIADAIADGRLRLDALNDRSIADRQARARDAGSDRTDQPALPLRSGGRSLPRV